MLPAHHCSDVTLPDGREMSHKEIMRQPELQRKHCLQQQRKNPANEHSRKNIDPEKRTDGGEEPVFLNEIRFKRKLSLQMWKAIIVKIMITFKVTFLSSKAETTPGRTLINEMSRITERIYLKGQYSINVIAKIPTPGLIYGYL